MTAIRPTHRIRRLDLARVSAVLGAVASLALACRRDEPAAPPPPPAVQLAPGDVVVARTATLETGPLVSGTLEAAQSATVRAQVGGTVRTVGPELGQSVTRGTVLARIDARGLGDVASSTRTQVAAARAQLEVARREAERTRTLVEAGAIARRELEQAETQVAAHQAALGQALAQRATAQQQLDDTVVRAPVSGVVAQREVNAGDVVAPGATLYQIIDPSSVRLSASVPSDQLGALAVGQPVRFTVHGYPDQTFTGALSRIAPAADPATKQVAILVDIPNPTHRLLAGLFARGRITAQTATGVVVPAAAIDSRGETPSVLRIATSPSAPSPARSPAAAGSASATPGTVVERVPVQLGLRDPLREEVVVTGIAAGTRVLARITAAPPPGAQVVLPPTQPTS